MHARQHEQFNALNEQNGLASAKLGDRIARALLGRARRILPHRARLGITCALEHFTAILAEQMLADDEHRESLRGRARELWLWHALEETEHKAVAFDVYRAIGGTHAMRVRTMIPASVFFVGATVVVYFAMTADRGVLFDVRGHLRVFDYLWLRRGLFRSLIGPYLEYYRRDFHPSDRDTRELVEQWNDALFGDAGVLRDRLFRKKSTAAA
jgi:predicted metal-dependent hydrolase